MKVFHFVLLLLVSSSAYSNYYCRGYIQHYGSSDISLNINNGHGVHVVCPIIEAYCKNWSALTLAAKVADKEILMYYQHPTISGDQSSGHCKTHGSWVNPGDKIYYLQLND